MTNLELIAQVTNSLDDILETTKLEHSVLLATIRIREVSENALSFQTRKLHSLNNLAGGLFHGIFVAHEAQAGHAGVTLNVHGDSTASLLCASRQLLRVLQVIAGLSNVILHQLCGIDRRGAAQDQDGGLHTSLADLNGLIQAGNAQIICAQFFQLLCDRNSAVAISISLYQAEVLCSCRCKPSQSMIIVGQFIKIYLCPSAFHLCVHVSHDPFSYVLVEMILKAENLQRITVEPLLRSSPRNRVFRSLQNHRMVSVPSPEVCSGSR